MMLTDTSISELWNEAQKGNALPSWRDNTAQGQEGIIRFARFVEIRTVEYITSTRGLKARQLGEWIRTVFGEKLQGSKNAREFLEGLGFFLADTTSVCPECGGTTRAGGAYDHPRFPVCLTCGGTGKVS